MKKVFKSLILGVGALLFSGGTLFAVELDKMGGVQIHGFISQGYLYSDDNNFYADTENGTPKFNELGINFASDVTDRLKMGVQLFRRNLGEFGGDVELDWGYASYLLRDWVGIRAGRMKIQHGLYNHVRDVDFTRTSVLLPQSVYNEAWRDTVNAIDGAALYGNIYLGNAGNLAYEFQGGTVKVETDGGVATTTREQLSMPLVGITFVPTSAKSTEAETGSLVWTTPVDGLKLGVSAWNVSLELEGSGAIKGTSMPLLFETNTKEICTSIEYNINNLTLAAEYAYNRYIFDLTLPAPIGKKTTPLETEGYYVSAAYRFNDIYELGMYYSLYYADKDNEDPSTGDRRFLQTSDAYLKDICLSNRFDITSNWVFKLEGHLMDGSALMMKENNPTPPGREDDWYLLAAKMTFSF